MPKYEVFGEHAPDHAILVEAASEAAALDQVARGLGHVDHASLILDGGGALIAELCQDGFVRRPGDIYGLMAQSD
jgi:hypothetical protein